MIPNKSTPTEDDRAAVTTLSHTLTLGMTSLLVLALMMGVTGFLDDQKGQTAESELRTIGNRLANEMSHVDDFGQQGGAVTVDTDHPNFVAGSPYDARLEHGASVCDDVTEDTCIVLTVSEFDVQETIPIHNQTTLHLTSRGSGTFLIESEGSSTNTHGEFTTVDMDSRIGIGRGVEGDAIESLVDPGNNPPLALFDFKPGTPTSGSPITFDASASYDSDGTILQYSWDFDDDGTMDAVSTSPTVQHSLPPGNHNVTLEVKDDTSTVTNVTRQVDVSGLRYLGDMDDKPGNGQAVTFSVENEFPKSIEIERIMVDPRDDSIDHLDSASFYEILVDAGDDGTIEEKTATDEDLYDGGRIFALDSEVEVDPNEEARITLRDFGTGMSAKNLTVGIRYYVVGVAGTTTPNSTIINDFVGGPDITDYRLTASGKDVDLTFVSTQQLDAISVQYGGNASGTLSRVAFTESPTGLGTYEYTADVSDGKTGTFWAKMTLAESGIAESGETPLNDTAIVSGDLTWLSAGDWDAATSETGLVHASYGDHDDAEVSLGYDADTPDLVGFWPLDDDGMAADASPEGNDGTVENGPVSANGIGVSDSLKFDGSNDYVEVPNDDSIDLGDTDRLTVSAWMKADDTWEDLPLVEHRGSYSLYVNDWWWFTEPTFDVDDATAYGGEVYSDQWHHIVATYDGSTGRLYLDGSLEDTEDFGDMDGAGDPLRFAVSTAGWGTDGTDFLDGNLDEVRIYERKLSDTEVEQLWKTPTEGSLTTDAKTNSGGNLDVSSLKLQYDVSNATGETVEVRVHSDQGETSDWLSVPDGTGSIPVTGALATDTDQFRLEIRLSSSLPTHSPVVNKLALTN